MAPSARGGGGAARGRGPPRAGATRRRPSEATSHSAAQPRSRAPSTGARPRVSRVTRARSSGARTTLHGLAALAEGEGGGRERAGKRGQRGAPARGAGRASSQATPRPSSRWAPRNTLKKGTAAAWRAARARWPRLAASPRSGRGETRAPSDEAEGGDDRVGVDEREQEVPAQEVGPPVGLRVPGEDEREVGEEERPGGERHRERGRAEAGGERPQGQRRGARAQRVTSKRVRESQGSMPAQRRAAARTRSVPRW